MRLLLVQLPTSHLGSGEYVYPLGLSRLAGTIPPETPTSALDMNVAGDPWRALKDTLAADRPRVVALSFRNMDPLAGHDVSYLSSLLTAARLVKRMVPHGRVVVGGPAFSLFAPELMAAVPDIDAGLIGEGEMRFSELVSHDFRPERIPGCIWRQDGRVRFTPPGKRVDVNALPPPDVKTFDPVTYQRRNAYVAAMGIEGKRGCDLHCAYCRYPYLGGTRLRLRSPQKIVDEIEYLRDSAGIELFHFTDGVVNRPPDHFEAVCRLLRRRRVDVRWTGFFRENHLTPGQVGLAVDAGLITLYLSADALTEHGLKLLRKDLEVADILRAARVTAARKVLTVCHFMANLPGETRAHRDEARATLETLLDVHAPAGNLGAVIFNNIRLYPRAPLTRRLLDEGWLDTGRDLMYPTDYNPPQGAHLKHEMEVLCHTAGVFSRLGLHRQPTVEKGCPQ